MFGNETNVKNDLDRAVTEDQKGIRTWQLMPTCIGENPDHMPLPSHLYRNPWDLYANHCQSEREKESKLLSPRG